MLSSSVDEAEQTDMSAMIMRVEEEMRQEEEQKKEKEVLEDQALQQIEKIA